MSQTQNILNHLKKGKSITAIEALNKFNCFRLAARISDLKAQGVDVKSKFITTSGNKQVKEYSL